MFSLAVVFVAGLGLMLGSFLNALLFRFNTGRSVLRGRSACMRCGHELWPLDLIPVLSYVFLRGRCRYCHTKISVQYPLVELAAGSLAVLAYLQNQELLGFSFQLLVSLVLLFIFVYDLRHKIIPWSASLLLTALSLAGIIIPCLSANGFQPTAFSFAAGPILAAPLLFLSFISGGRWMGWGDGFLELSLGWLLGITAGLTALLLAFWAGAAVGIALLLLPQNRYTMKSEVPFAPFLIAGCAIATFLHVDLFSSLPFIF